MSGNGVYAGGDVKVPCRSGQRKGSGKKSSFLKKLDFSWTIIAQMFFINRWVALQM
jgi:hypothetical protein